MRYVMSRYQNLMFQEAFGNYETLLRKVTYNPAMGNYLDMVNNDRAPAQPATSTRVPNENYAREIMQLFSIDLDELNADGTPLLDAQGKPIPTYGQAEIAEFAKVFTGYTYANAAGTPPTGKTGTRYYAAPMVPYPDDQHHRAMIRSPRRCSTALRFPPDQTAQQDIDAAVRNVFMHPNTAGVRQQAADPASRDRQSVAGLRRARRCGLQQQRRGRAWRHGGGGQGDPARPRSPRRRQDGIGLRHAARAGADGHGHDPRAQRRHRRQPPRKQPPATSGSVRTTRPRCSTTSCRTPKVPGTSILGPEFGIHTTVSAVGRANLSTSWCTAATTADTTIPKRAAPSSSSRRSRRSPINPAAMVSLINQHLAGGQFPAALEPTIVTAVSAITMSATPTAAERTNRARMAVYLMASSYDFQVQR